MRTREELRAVRRLSSEGVGLSAIARATGVPRSTVARWLGGGAPAWSDPDAETCRECGHPRHEGLDGAAYSHLLGLYLGDGHIATFPRTSCLRIYLDERYPRIVESCARMMRSIAPTGRAAVHHKTGCAIVQSYSKAWPCLLPQHGAGHKHERPIVLAPWQGQMTSAHARQLVRGLIESDGSRHENVVRRHGRSYRYSRYTFSNRSEDIKSILCEHLDLLGIAWRRAGPANISIARREAVAALDAFVGPKS